MGLTDSFIDEKATCPKCGSPQDNWQTKDLEPMMESWHRGDFFQYHRWRSLTKREEKKIIDDGTGVFLKGHLIAPIGKKSGYISRKPLIENGMVEVYSGCRSKKCDAWLHGLAKIYHGKFVGIRSIRAVRRTRSRSKPYSIMESARDSWGSKEGKLIFHKQVGFR